MGNQQPRFFKTLKNKVQRLSRKGVGRNNLPKCMAPYFKRMKI